MDESDKTMESDEARVEQAGEALEAARPYDSSTLAQFRARRSNLVYNLYGPIARFMATVDAMEAERDKARALAERFLDEASTARLSLSQAERESAGYRQFLDDARLKLGAALGCNLEYEQPDWPAIEDKIRGLRAGLLQAEAERDAARAQVGQMGQEIVSLRRELAQAQEALEVAKAGVLHTELMLDELREAVRNFLSNRSLTICPRCDGRGTRELEVDDDGKRHSDLPCAPCHGTGTHTHARHLKTLLEVRS